MANDMPYYKDDISQNIILLDWSAKQGRILTAEGKALQYYSQENGYLYRDDELPHYYVERGISHSIFRQWAIQDYERESSSLLSIDCKNNISPSAQTNDNIHQNISSPIIGVWDRPLFAGKWEHTTNKDEIVYNIQTKTLFVDLRIPRNRLCDKLPLSFEMMNNEQLRIYARTHVFGGYSKIATQSHDRRPICTRHHCLDWNYIPGKPRPRPNKWYIEKFNKDIWNESSFATDEYKQSYYTERWERRKGDDNGNGLRLAMRKKKVHRDDSDGILVVTGNHFNYILGRQLFDYEMSYPNAKSLVELVDAAIENNDRDTAIIYLSRLDGGPGTISSNWEIDCSIQPCNHGKNVFEYIGGGGNGRVRVVVGNDSDDYDFFSWDVYIGNTLWEMYESSITSPSELEKVVNSSNRCRL